MASQADERTMISERVAPGMLPRVLNSADMTIIFVAIVLFIVNASAIQRAGPSAYTFWIIGFLAFLIPGALGVPVLDGLGAEGGGAHARDEHVLLDSIPVRAALLALLLIEPGL